MSVRLHWTYFHYLYCPSTPCVISICPMFCDILLYVLLKSAHHGGYLYFADSATAMFSYRMQWDVMNFELRCVVFPPFFKHMLHHKQIKLDI